MKKTYFIYADTKAVAKARAKNNDWDDADGDEPTGIIKGITIKSIECEDASVMDDPA